MNAASISLRLRGHRSADGFLCHCPVEEHGKRRGDRNPSLLLKDGERRLLVKCFAGCDPSDILDALRRRGLVENPKSKESNIRFLGAQPPASEPDPDSDALALWHDAGSMTDQLGERYLRAHRRTTIEIPPSLRFLPHARYPHTGYSFPAVVAAVQWPDGKIVAIQVTYLRSGDGTKAPLSAPRITIGRLGTGAIRLGPVDDVLGLAEGTETALSAMELSGIPCWASLGGQRLGKITIPASVRHLHIFGDDDVPGRRDAEKAAGQYTRQGLKVTLRWPPSGCGDWNDALKQITREAA